MSVYNDRAEALERGGPAAQAVLRYNDLMQQLADQARQPSFAKSEWDALGEVVATKNFQRFGNFMEQQDWKSYVDMLHKWATNGTFSSEFRRMTETDNIVFLQLQENNSGHIVNSLSVYELNAVGKIFKLHIYLQMKAA